MRNKFLVKIAVLVLIAASLMGLGVSGMTVSGHTNAVLPSSSISRYLNGAITLDYKTDIVMYSSNVSHQVSINGGIVRLMAVYTAYNLIRNNAAVKYDISAESLEDLCVRMLFGHLPEDAALQLATGISPSVSEFVKLMNDTAKSIGMYDTVYTNCTGADDKNQRSSVNNQMLLFAKCYEYEEIQVMLEGNVYYIDENQSYSRNIPLLDSDNKNYYDSRVTHYISSDYSPEGYFIFSASNMTQSNASGRAVLSVVYESGANDFGSGMTDIKILNNNSFNDYYWVILTDLAKRVCAETYFELGDGKVALCSVELKSGDDGITTMSKNYYNILVEQNSKCTVNLTSKDVPDDIEAGDILSEAELCFGNDILLTFDLRITAIKNQEGGMISSSDYHLYDPDNYKDQMENQFNRLEFFPYAVVVIVLAIGAVVITRIMRKKWMI